MKSVIWEIAIRESIIDIIIWNDNGVVSTVAEL